MADVFASRGQRKHFCVVSRDLPSTYADVFRALVGVGVRIVRDVGMLVPNARSAADVIYTRSGASILLGTVAKVKVDTDSCPLQGTTFGDLFESKINIFDEAVPSVLVRRRDSLDINLESGVFREARLLGGVEGGKLEHPFSQWVVEGGKIFEARESMGCGRVMGEIVDGGMGALPRSPCLHALGRRWKTGEDVGRRDRRLAAFEWKRERVS